MLYLSLCAIVKDENVYLPEWLAYHRAVGVEHFFLYDNESATPLQHAVDEAGQSRYVTVVKQHGRGMQGLVYEDCIAKHSKETFWLGFIDIDEFVVPKAALDFRDVLRCFESFSGLGVNWQTFGHSGHETRPPGLQMEAFTRRAPSQWATNHHIKSFVRPSRVGKYLNPHAFTYHTGFCVNENRVKVEGAFNGPALHHMAQLNHYLLRSKQETREKVARGSGDGLRKKQADMERWGRECDAEEDRDILRFAAATKAMMGGKP